MIILYKNDVEDCLDEEGIPHCAACGRALDTEWRFYVWDGIPYCRGCVLGFSVSEMIRICETGETGWLLKQGFEAWGRLPDGEH